MEFTGNSQTYKRTKRKNYIWNETKLWVCCLPCVNSCIPCQCYILSDRRQYIIYKICAWFRLVWWNSSTKCYPFWSQYTHRDREHTKRERLLRNLINCGNTVPYCLYEIIKQTAEGTASTSQPNGEQTLEKNFSRKCLPWAIFYLYSTSIRNSWCCVSSSCCQYSLITR